MASPVRDAHGQLVGIVAVNLSLMELSEPLVSVVSEQQKQGRHLSVGIIDSDGVLIATPDHQRIMQTVVDELPGAEDALHGHNASNVGPGPDGQDWLFSAVPVNNAHWAVVVQMPVSEALAVVEQLHLWLLYAAGLFVLAGLLFWLILMLRVIQPLHILAFQHQVLPATPDEISRETHRFAARLDEMGDLARSPDDEHSSSVR
jgi:sensor histidine kinase regulating citrate/malate metabolism